MSQHMDALAEANRVRLARVALGREVADGTVTVAEILDRCPWEAAGMSIFNLLRRQRHWGPYRTRRLLAELRIDESRRVDDLTEGERKRISFYLSPWRAAR
jgi:hypothetical protein